MKNAYADQTANGAKGSRARHVAADSDSSFDTRSEKTLVEHSEKAIKPPPPSTPRRGFWRRILDRLSGSKYSSGPNGSPPLPDPPLPDPPEKTHDSPTKVPRKEGYAKPRTTCTVEGGCLPSPRQYTYGIARGYSPVERVTPDTLASAPWVIQARLHSHAVATLVDAPPRWLEDLHLCWFDQISISYRALANRKRSYQREVRVAYASPGGSQDWAARFTIWHDDAEWLAGLSYSDMRGLLLRGSLFRTSARKSDPDARLEHSKLVYLRFQKPGVYFGVEHDVVQSAESLRANLDIQDPLVWSQFDRHSDEEDWSL